MCVVLYLETLILYFTGRARQARPRPRPVRQVLRRSKGRARRGADHGERQVRRHGAAQHHDARAEAVGVQVLPLEGHEGPAAEAEGPAGDLLVAVQAGRHHVPEGPHGAQRQGRRAQGRSVHRAHARGVLHVGGDN